ncbi:MAG: rod shape-determining protein MreC [Oscillospiraceae bacterium]|jgi:rod shape-determining protein MreC|nr:rod shape-determining protein MreC [Oscillospiraceae bacterium]
MKDFFKSVRFKILIFIAAGLIGVAVYAAVSGGTASAPERAFQFVTSPFTTAMSKLSDFAEDRLDRIVNAEKYKRENLLLRQQLSDMWTEVNDKEKTEKENEQLKKMLGIAETRAEFVWAPPCEIIARNANDVFGGFTVNRGSDDGIKPGDPVFTEIGLVGKVTEVAPDYAKVATLLSPEVGVGVSSARNKTVGVIDNNIDWASQNRCRMGFIDSHADIKPGDIIVTSAESIFPPNLVVGTVESTEPGDNGLSLYVAIVPAVDIHVITDVFIVIGTKKTTSEP